MLHNDPVLPIIPATFRKYMSHLYTVLILQRLGFYSKESISGQFVFLKTLSGLVEQIHGLVKT
jgi:hypothetical protein